MKRRILLLEPNYRNKYPPIGLMKLAMYHRLQDDDVVFYKGDLRTFVLSQIAEETITSLSTVDPAIDWRSYTPGIKDFILYGKITPESEFEKVTQRPFVLKWMDHARRDFRTGGYFKEPRWDRVCVTTLFTFHWDLTIETISFAKKVCKDPAQVMVGGVMASVVPDAVEKATGIRPHVGCLTVSLLPGDKPVLKPLGKTPIDALPLDYSILEEIDYRYPATDAYYAYATRGCVNKCPFCAVPILEPGRMKHFALKPRIEEARERFGEQRHLLLLDNNVFASKKFDIIIDEIRDSGFAKGATFVPPNPLDIAIRQLRDGWNNRAYIRMAVRLLNEWTDKLKGEQHERIYGFLLNHGLLHAHTAKEDNVLAVYELVKDEYEKTRSKKPHVRFIDFNQGMDARLATPEKMEKLAEINIRPLRIAFDNWGERKHYARAVQLAKANGITQMSNYLLYNFRDAPIDLYRRLLLNIDLCSALGVNIYSFPMKYHPIMDEKWFSNRDYIGSEWSRKAIRTVQSVLNSTHGKIGRGRDFFFKAFGRTEEEFDDLLRMPEAFIIKRWDAELLGLTAKWREAYKGLSAKARVYVDKVVDTNVFKESVLNGQSAAVRRTLGFYMIDRDCIKYSDEAEKALRIRAFDESCPTEISDECRLLLERA